VSKEKVHSPLPYPFLLLFYRKLNQMFKLSPYPARSLHWKQYFRGVTSLFSKLKKEKKMALIKM